MGRESLDYFKGDELAASVWQSKYAWKDEKTPDDMHKRMAKEFARVDIKYQERERRELPNPCRDYEFGFWQNQKKLSEYGKKREFLTEDSIYLLFKDFRYVIPQGSVMAGLGTTILGSLSNCFVLGQPSDSYGGIFKKDQETAQLEKRRGGVGVDLSSLRPAGVATSNAAKSSTGAVSFMHRFSNTTREVAQNGRRGALMLSMDVNHPDIEDFVKVKRDLTQVTGANISVKLNDEFMEAVIEDTEYVLRFPTNIELDGWAVDLPLNKTKDIGNGVLYKKIKARDLWREIIKSAHMSAEPGILNWDHVVNYSPDSVYEQFLQEGTNPCSEIAMQAYDACRLIALNLFSFVVNPYTEDAYFDHQKFYEVNYEAMRLSDDLIDLEIENINRLLDKIESDPEPDDEKMVEYNLWQQVKETALASRRTGLGITGLADTIAALGIKYDSEPAIAEMEYIMKTKMESELDCTIDLAILRGTFEGQVNEKEFSTLNEEIKGNNPFYQMLQEEFPLQSGRMREFGRRNLSWSTIAPTGSLSMLAQVSSGMEPVFLPFYKRRKKVNSSEEPIKIDFIDANGDAWQEFFVLHEEFKKWIILTSSEEVDPSTWSEILLEEAFNNSPWAGSTAPEIDWKKRIKVQSTLQKYITHSISSTINLPSTVTEKEVSEIYIEAWKQGLKGVTVYRDGSRDGVLLSTDSKKEEFKYVDAHPRPKCLPVDIHTMVSKGIKWNVIVGLYDGKPYETLAVPYFTSKTSMELCKKGKGHYDLIHEGKVLAGNITSEMSQKQETVTRLISTSLRHRADIKFIVEQLNKSEEEDMFSFIKVIARCLKKYIPDGAKATVSCSNPDCTGDGTNVVFEEGCHKCLDCGNSKCG